MSNKKKFLHIREKELSPLHRILLHTSGTVTEILRQWTNSNIIIVKPPLNTCFLYDKLEKTKLYFSCKSDGIPWLREVVLQNVGTKQNLVYAFSQVYLKNLNRQVKYKLEHSDYGIGEIIEQEKLETYRQIEEFNKISVAGEYDFFKKVFPRAKKFILHRAYNIFRHKKLWFTINEYFPSEPEHFDFQVADSDKNRILGYSKDILNNKK